MAVTYDENVILELVAEAPQHSQLGSSLGLNGASPG